MDVSEAIRHVRKRAGLTQSELAERVGTTQSAISRVESGRIRPSLDTLERVAEACGSNLELRFAPPETVLAEFESNLTLTPAERLEQLVRTVRFITEGRKAMSRHGG